MRVAWGPAVRHEAVLYKLDDMKKSQRKRASAPLSTAAPPAALPATPLTDPDSFTTEEIANWFQEEFGIDLSGKTDEVVQGYVKMAQGGEDIVAFYESMERALEWMRNRSPSWKACDEFGPEEHQMDLQLAKEGFKIQRSPLSRPSQ